MIINSKSLVHVLNQYPDFFSMLHLQKLFSTFNARFIMKKIFHAIIISMLLLLFLSCSSTKEFGKVFTSEEADKLFGTVLFSASVQIQDINALLGKTDKTIMFGIINKTVIILDNNRRLIYPEEADYKDSDVFTVYSVSLVKELISEFRQKKMGPEDEVNVEQRREVLSVSYGNNTLETGAKCPPLCEAE